MALYVEIVFCLWSFLMYVLCNSTSYILSDGRIRIISEVDTCSKGTIEINDYYDGWTPITSTAHCSLSTQSSFTSSIGDIICNQLGFNSLQSYEIMQTNVEQTGYNSIYCETYTTDICTQCELGYDDPIIKDCDDRNIYVECEGFGIENTLDCVPFSEYTESDSDSKCNQNKHEDIISYNLAKKFYEDETFIKVVVVIGLVVGCCCMICICNYCQTEYNECESCKGCIRCLMCKCFGYEVDEDEGRVSKKVADKRKADRRARKKYLNDDTDVWSVA